MSDSLLEEYQYSGSCASFTTISVWCTSVKGGHAFASTGGETTCTLPIAAVASLVTAWPRGSGTAVAACSRAVVALGVARSGIVNFRNCSERHLHSLTCFTLTKQSLTLEPLMHTCSDSEHTTSYQSGLAFDRPQLPGGARSQPGKCLGAPRTAPS